MDRQRYQRYSLSDLVPGDRFYFQGDKKKKLFDLSKDNTFFVRQQAGWNVKYATVIPANVPGAIPEIHKANRFVIFIRNINN